jgi:hypothetical protein
MAEPLFKHRYSLEVEPQDPTHSAEDAKRQKGRELQYLDTLSTEPPECQK